MKLPDGAHDVTIVGDGQSILHASAKFHGRAIFSCKSCQRIRFTKFSIDGNRQALERPMPLAPTDKSFASVFSNNGILIENSDGIALDHVDFSNTTNFAVI